MPLNDLLCAGRVTILSGRQDRAAVLDAAARLLATPTPGETLATNAAPPNAALIGERLRARELLASTAIGHGVAIPHARVDAIDESRGAFLRLEEPIDFGAADGNPVDLILAMLVPQHSTMKHLEQLAELAEYFSEPDFRSRLREAADIGALTHCLLTPLVSVGAD